MPMAVRFNHEAEILTTEQARNRERLALYNLKRIRLGLQPVVLNVPPRNQPTHRDDVVLFTR